MAVSARFAQSWSSALRPACFSLSLSNFWTLTELQVPRRCPLSAGTSLAWQRTASSLHREQETGDNTILHQCERSALGCGASGPVVRGVNCGEPHFLLSRLCPGARVCAGADSRQTQAPSLGCRILTPRERPRGFPSPDPSTRQYPNSCRDCGADGSRAGCPAK